MTINERFIWGLETLNLQASDKVLEIGCGAGIFAELIGKKLSSGKITAIDRSAAMIRMASKRNNELIENGRGSFMAVDFAKTTFKKGEFDKIVAFNVNFFWKNPKKELELIRNYLKTTGLLYIFYQTPHGVDDKLVQGLKEPLLLHSFQIKNVIINSVSSNESVCIISNP